MIEAISIVDLLQQKRSEKRHNFRTAVRMGFGSQDWRLALRRAGLGATGFGVGRPKP